MSAVGSEEHGHFQSLRLHVPQNELNFKSSAMEDGLIEYLITWVPLKANTTLRLSLDEQTLEIATTSTSLQLPMDKSFGCVSIETARRYPFRTYAD